MSATVQPRNQPNLQTLSASLAGAEAARTAVEQIDALQTRVRAHETRLLDACDVSDPNDFIAIGRARLQLELIPKRRILLEHTLASAREALCAQLMSVIPNILEPRIEAKRSQVKAVIKKQLQPILPASTDLDRAVEEAYRENKTGAAIEACSMSGFYSVPDPVNAERAARILLKHVHNLEALNKLERLA